MKQREITRDVQAVLPYFRPATARSIAKRARRRNADVCALLRSITGYRVACHGVVLRIVRTRHGYRAPIAGVSTLFGGDLDLSQEFADVIREVEADSRFGLFLGVGETAG
ncbi:MAG TPA: hypothetical protein VN650_02415 [Gemmatimonadaceae bacterium]|nr:hypothetical protein [Gemmatimonadaceae bacterium]